MDETERRRRIQLEHNKQNNITPQTIRKGIRKSIEDESASKKIVMEMVKEEEAEYVTQEYIRELEEEMLQAASDLNFEKAAEIRDRVLRLQSETEVEHAGRA
jgi:excinuclease ABC subunit B